MNKRHNLVRAMAALAAAAACAIALDAAIVLADGGPATTRPAAAVTTQPVAVSASTQPVFVGGAISNDYARPARAADRPPALAVSPNGGSSVQNAPATVNIGGGVDSGQTAAAPAASNTSVGTTGQAVRR